MKKYDVVIVNLNGEKILKSCLRSVYNSSVVPEKVIVYDNNSSDRSTELIRNNYPEVKLICSKKNIGFGGGNNEAMKYAQSDYILFMNNDLILDKHCAENLIGFLNDKKVVVANPLIYKGWEKRKNQPIYASGAVLERSGFNYALYDLDGDRQDLNCFSGACFMACTNIVKDLKFEKRYFLYYEEPEMTCRMLKQSMKIGRSLDAKCYHLENYSSPKEGAKGVAFRQFHSIQNKWYMFGKHWPITALFPAVILNYIHLGVVSLFFLRHGQFNSLRLIYLAPYKLISGMVNRDRTKIIDRRWYQKLEKYSFGKYLGLGKKVFSKKNG